MKIFKKILSLVGIGKQSKAESKLDNKKRHSKKHSSSQKNSSSNVGGQKKQNSGKNARKSSKARSRKESSIQVVESKSKKLPTGFPGESEQDFCETMEFARAV